MPVNSQHPEYKANIALWRKCRDVKGGEEAVKHAGVSYLPKLSGQGNIEYSAYLSRALFYNATARTIQGTIGSIFRKPPIIEPPSDYIADKCSTTTEEVLSVGRAGILVDVPKEGGEPYFVEYAPEQIINWDYEMIDDKEVVKLVVLEEYKVTDTDDQFVKNVATQYRVLDLGGENGSYRQRVFTQKTGSAVGKKVTNPVFEEDPDQLVEPEMRGEKMKEIPFEFFGPQACSATVQKPALLDLVNVNLSHFRSSADLEHGRHFTALPTAWVAGFSSDTKLTIGSGTAWVTENVNAKAGFLEFTGAGLGALETALEQKEHLMAVLGARLFETAKSGVEAAETVRLRKSADTSQAAILAQTVSHGLERCYQWYLDFKLGTNGQKAKVEINTDILDSTMPATEIAAYVEAWQKGAISTDTMLWNLKSGEVLPPDVTTEEEKSKLEQEQDRINLLNGITNPVK